MADPFLPWYVTLIVLATNLFVTAAVWTILARGAERAGLSADAARRVKTGGALFLGVWLGLAILLAPSPATLPGRDPFYISPLIPGFALGGIGLASVLIALSPSLRRAIGAASLPALVGVQVYRVIGLLFLIVLALGRLPARFAEPAGWGDIAVGLAAPLVGLALARGMARARGLAIGWNVVGLLDLVGAVGMGTGLLAPLLLPGLGPRVPAAAAMGAFPLIVVPAFTVPVSVLLHLVSLRRLVREVPVRPGLMPRGAGAR